ncbi:MAG: glycosyltransferase family 2 protein [archaeon]
MSKWLSIKKNKYKNLTIAFSGKNIKEYLILAIESFLHFYPELKDNIVVFDDKSTDGTKEWLNSRNIRWITWEHFSEDLRNKSNYSRSIGDDVGRAFKIDLIIKELLLQINTKYLLLNDGDVVFLDKGFLEKYINSDNIVIGPECYFNYNKQLITQYPKYEELIHPEDLEKYNNEEYHDIIRVYRLWPYHIFCNLELIKMIGMLGDSYNYILSKNKNKFMPVDPGHDILLRLMHEEIPHKMLSENEINKYIYHFTFIANVKNRLRNPDKFVIKDKIKYLEGNIKYLNHKLNLIKKYDHVKYIIKINNLDFIELLKKELKGK